jgi:putative ABC transport system permease protein
LFTVARLLPGVGSAAAAGDLQRVAGDLRRDLPDVYREPTWTLGLVSLRESLFGHMRLSLGVLQGAAAFVLLIACVNVSIMSLLRAAGRRRELAIRFAIGAGRSHVVRQLLTEAAVLCTLGALGGLVLARGAVAALKAFAPTGIPRLEEVGLSRPVTISMAAVLFAMTLIVGLAPAVLSTRDGVAAGGALTGRASDGRATTRLRDGLTIIEIALAAALVICAGLTLRSLHRLLSVDMGFTTTQVVSFKTNLTERAYPDASAVERFYGALNAKLEALPGVRRVGGVSYLPLSGEGQFVTAVPDGSPDAANMTVGWDVVRGRYFETMGITLLHGRLFDASDRSTTSPVAIVDAALARHWFANEAAAIGQRLRIGVGAREPARTIVGVVRAVSHTGPGRTTPPMAYAPQTQVYQRGMYTVIETSTRPDALLRAARAALASVDPAIPMYFAASVERRYDDAVALPRFIAGLVSAFSTLALVLAGVGIFGVTAYGVSQRMREFGIRVALGAQRGHVSAIVLGRVVVLAALGIASGSALGFGLGSAMSSLLYEVAPADPASFSAALVAIGLTALVATIAPLCQAVRVSPAVILKAE